MSVPAHPDIVYVEANVVLEQSHPVHFDVESLVYRHDAHVGTPPCSETVHRDALVVVSRTKLGDRIGVEQVQPDLRRHHLIVDKPARRWIAAIDLPAAVMA